MPRLFNAIIGTRFKLVSGYPASTEAMLAMERGEVEGATSSWAAVTVTKQTWLREKKIRIILQTHAERHPDLPDAPSLTEIGNTPEDRQVTALYASGSGVGRSLIAPPEVPRRAPESPARRLQRRWSRIRNSSPTSRRSTSSSIRCRASRWSELIVRTLNVPPPCANAPNPRLPVKVKPRALPRKFFPLAGWHRRD